MTLPIPPCGNHREVTYRTGGPPSFLLWPLAVLGLLAWAASASLRWLLRVR